MKNNIDARIYRKQIIESAEEAKQYFKIPADIIKETTNDSELGYKIRMMYWDMAKQLDEHIEHIKSLNKLDGNEGID
jgi:hypothetical protein